MKKNIVIVHYNTPYLTECLVRSINLFVRDAVIYIFDNSDKQPFTAKFDNVTIIDNTAGQIINFDEWLKQYPESLKSTGRLNHYASAKHCYTIQKCIDMFDENFVLLDSDIFLKRDISNLFSTEEVVMASTEAWKGKSRIIPYICFINVKKCKELGIRYFDENHIHGLTKVGDRYDTGAFFYEQIHDKKLSIKRLSLSEYIVHYKAASWVEDAKKHHGYRPMDCNEWIEKYKKYWYKRDLVHGDKVVYTCITGGYDKLRDPKHITKGWDYICFTDNPNLNSSVWDVRPLPEETEGLSQVKKQRYVKINAHKVLPDYKLSVWVDGNVEVVGNLDKLVDSVLVDGVSVYVPSHPLRKCAYAEAKAVISLKKDKPENVEPQMKRYKNEGFPKDFGLLQSNILLRKHNEEDCVKLMEDWFEELKENSHRDQLSFNYVLWKNSDIHVVYLDKHIYDSEWFKWRKGHGIGSSATREVTIARKASRIHENREMFNALIRSRKLQTHNVNIYQ